MGLLLRSAFVHRAEQYHSAPTPHPEPSRSRGPRWGHPLQGLVRRLLAFSLSNTPPSHITAVPGKRCPDCRACPAPSVLVLPASVSVASDPRDYSILDTVRRRATSHSP